MTSFADLVDLALLARAVGTAAEKICEYADHPDQTTFYEVIGIPKRGKKRAGQRRIVYAALEDWLSDLHKNIAVLVNRNVVLPECVQGFAPGRSIYTNAAQHLGARLLLHGDLAGFFDTITLAHVRDAFVGLGAPAAMADVLARATTIDGQLHQGTRCSPAIANIVCKQLDQDFLQLAAAHSARYTRYADNLTFSGDRVPSSESVEQIVRKHGFVLRDGTCYEQRRGRAQYVTGLTVSDPARPHLPRRRKRQLRLVLHHIAKRGLEQHLERVGARADPLTRAAITGMVAFLRPIEPKLAERMNEQLEAGIARSKALHDEAERAAAERDPEPH